MLRPVNHFENVWIDKQHTSVIFTMFYDNMNVNPPPPPPPPPPPHTHTHTPLPVLIWWRHDMITFSALMAFCEGNHRRNPIIKWPIIRACLWCWPKIVDQPIRFLVIWTLLRTCDVSLMNPESYHKTHAYRHSASFDHTREIPHWVAAILMYVDWSMGLLPDT